ncbi:cellulose binding domain-containing protein [Actinomadura fulvescens]|uniref:Cellulose binding domain-containing protein n=1 Tax=Actinomadura fulvescens TaxID=46160 RepID=A0ABP6D061_9ACTN
MKRVLMVLLLVLAGTIVPALPAQAAAATATFAKTADWGSGYEGKYTITNGTDTALTGWSVSIELPAGGTVSSAWDASLARSGQRFTFTNVGWNGTVAPGANVSFGFIATPGTAVPAGCTLNGQSCSGSGNPGAPGQPGAVTATTTDTSVTLRWDASSGTVTGYRVYEGSTQKTQVTGTTATISGLGTCQTHTYTVKAYNSAGESAGRDVTATTTGCTQPQPGKMAGAPYLYMGWGNPPNPGTVMDATGVKAFTMAFILSSGGCNPAWDGQRPLTGGPDAQAISTIKSKGGDVQISFGGWSGNKLGPACSTPEAYAGAVQKVIDAVRPAVVDFDIENTDEFENHTVQDRILNGLKIVKQRNPAVKIVVTIPTLKSGPNSHGVRLINQSKALNVPIDNYTIMPFNFGATDMYQDNVTSSEGLKNALKNAFAWSDAQAYAHMGISGMNGYSDQREVTSPETWTRIRDWAKSKGLTRFAFWSVNRDRVNGGGVPQGEWEFTRITAGF